MGIIITDHAYLRAKERLSFSPSTLDRLAPKAFSGGITHKDTKGKVNRYITKLWNYNKSINNIRVYGEVVFLFSDNILVTLYQIPNEFKRMIKNFKAT